MKNIGFKIIILLTIFFCQDVTAQNDQCGCSVALKKDYLVSSKETFESLHYLENISEKEFNEIKNSGGVQGSYGLIGGSANFNEFKKNVTDKIKSTEIQTSKIYKASSFEYRTNPIVYQYWENCMVSCNGVGAYLWLKEETKTHLLLRLRYKASPGIGGNANYNLTINYSDKTEIKSGRIRANADINISIPKRCDTIFQKSEISISAIVGNSYSTDFIVSKFYCGTPPIEKCKSEIVIKASDYIDGTGIAENKYYGEHVITNNAPGGRSQYNKAIYVFNSGKGCLYNLNIEYASLISRPVKIYLNDKFIREGCSETTGGWFEEDQKILNQAIVECQEGSNILKLERTIEIPHIKSIRLLNISE